MAAGVDDPRFAQHGKQVGAALDRVLARLQRALDHVGDDRVLLAGGRVGAEPRFGHVRELGGDAVGHLAHHGQDRALGRLTHRSVCLVGSARQCRADQDRIDQLARAAGELLGGAADQLREDHARVPARTEERGAGDRVDDLVAADLVDRPSLGRGR